MIETRITTCSRDCPDACGIEVDVEDGSAVALRGDARDPITQGFLCPRTGRFLARQYAPDRFLSPMLRRDDRLEPLTWDAALDLAARELERARDEHGAAAVMHYRSGGSLGILKYVTGSFFARWGPVTVKHGSVCSGAGDAAQTADFGGVDAHDPDDLLDARLIVLWGKNPHTSSVHLVPVLKRARERGAFVVALDPVRTRAALLADRFWQPRPGGDYAVAMGIARGLFHRDAIPAEAASRCENLAAFRDLAFAKDAAGWAAEADVDVAALDEMAELFATRAPAAVVLGWGLGRRLNGARTVRAIDGLIAITGNLGVPGGGVSFCHETRSGYDRTFGFGAVAPPRTLSEPLLGREILAARRPPIRCVWVTAANPVTMLPDSHVVREALRSRFTVVVETHPTDTTDVASLILPTLTLLEDRDLHGGYGHHQIRSSTGAIAPPDGPRHEVEIIQGLAERLGLGAEFGGDVESWMRRALAPFAPHGVDLETLDRGPRRTPLLPERPFAGGVTRHPHGRTALLAERAAPPRPTDATWPLTLLAVSTPDAQSSQWSRPPAAVPSVRVHPAAAGGFADGAEARLESALGSLRVCVRHDATLRPDVALMEKGGMLRQGRGVNALVEARETDEGSGASYYDQPVRLV